MDEMLYEWEGEGKFNILERLKAKAFSLALAIYRLTDFFPQGEVLKNQLKILANEIYAQLASNNFYDTISSVEKILAYFKIAAAQKWVKEINFVILEEHYRSLKESLEILTQLKEEKSLKIEKPVRKIAEKKNRNKGLGMNFHQGEMLGCLRNNRTAKMADFLKLFDGKINERTLRRHLQVLIDQGLVGKIGNFKHTNYYLA